VEGLALLVALRFRNTPHHRQNTVEPIPPRAPALEKAFSNRMAHCGIISGLLMNKIQRQN
jgi:hypothetical protein